MAFNLVTSRSRKAGKRHINAEINVTPLVDVMLVLLVIFMITSPMLVAGVQVDLPKTKASALSGQDEPIAISVDKFGNIYIHETKIKMEDLEKKLAAVSQERKDIRIFVRGDKTIDYGRVMQVFGAIKSAGYKNIALVSETIN
jgi:biopolymer transport protein TolR